MIDLTGNGYMAELLDQDRCPACRTYLKKSEEGWTCPTCSLVIVEKKMKNVLTILLRCRIKVVWKQIIEGENDDQAEKNKIG